MNQLCVTLSWWTHAIMHLSKTHGMHKMSPDENCGPGVMTMRQWRFLSIADVPLGWDVGNK